MADGSRNINTCFTHFLVKSKNTSFSFAQSLHFCLTVLPRTFLLVVPTCGWKILLLSYHSFEYCVKSKGVTVAEIPLTIQPSTTSKESFLKINEYT